MRQTKVHKKTDMNKTFLGNTAKKFIDQYPERKFFEKSSSHGDIICLSVQLLKKTFCNIFQNGSTKAHDKKNDTRERNILGDVAKFILNDFTHKQHISKCFGQDIISKETHK